MVTVITAKSGRFPLFQFSGGIMEIAEIRKLFEDIIKENGYILDEVLYQRLPNKSIPDTPQRIATDTSQKVPVRYGETIKSYLASKDLSVDDLHFIPLAIAGWLRYLLGLDDNLEAMELSSDPMLDVLTKKLANVKSSLKYNGELKDILSNSVIFGTDLTKTSLASKVETYYEGMLVKSGVRKVLSETVKKYAK